MKVVMYSDKRIIGDDGTFAYRTPKFFTEGERCDYFALHGDCMNKQKIREWYHERGIPEATDPMALVGHKPRGVTYSGITPGKLQDAQPTGSANPRGAIEYQPPSDGPIASENPLGDAPNPTGLVTDNEPQKAVQTVSEVEASEQQTESIREPVVTEGTTEEPVVSGDTGTTSTQSGQNDIVQWRDLAWPQKRSLAKKYTDEPIRNAADAERVLTQHIG